MGKVSTSLAKISSEVCSCSVSVAVGIPLSMSTVPDFAFVPTGVSRGEMVACEGEGEWAVAGVFSMVGFKRRPSFYSCGLVCWMVLREKEWCGDVAGEQERDSERGESKQRKERKTQQRLKRVSYLLGYQQHHATIRARSNSGGLSPTFCSSPDILTHKVVGES